MYVVTFTTDELETLQRLKPDIYDILAKVPYSGREKRTYVLSGEQAKAIALISRNKHTISMWNQFHVDMRQKFLDLHRNFFKSAKRNARRSWLTYVEIKHRATLNDDLEILEIA